MTAKEYLMQARKLDREIKLAKEKILKMRSALYGKSITYDGDGAQHTGASDNSTERAIVAVTEYERKKNVLICTCIETRIEIEKTIQIIPDEVQREILERRYLLYQDWESHYDKRTGEYIKGIDEALGYEARQVYRKHGEALRYLSKYIKSCQ